MGELPYPTPTLPYHSPTIPPYTTNRLLEIMFNDNVKVFNYHNSEFTSENWDWKQCHWCSVNLQDHGAQTRGLVGIVKNNELQKTGRLSLAGGVGNCKFQKVYLQDCYGILLMIIFDFKQKNTKQMHFWAVWSKIFALISFRGVCKLYHVTKIPSNIILCYSEHHKYLHTSGTLAQYTC